jgi:hypothetical protein
VRPAPSGVAELVDVLERDRIAFLDVRFESVVHGARRFVGTVCIRFSRDVIFLREDANFGRGPLENLAQRLAELLEREPGDSLRAELQIAGIEFAETDGFCLRITLYAQGNTPGQAALRWGLGLARLQQALLFVARGLRQQLGAAG